MLVLLPLLLVTVALVSFDAYSRTQDTQEMLAEQRNMLIEERRAAVQDIVQVAMTAIAPIYEAAGPNDEAAKQEVASIIRAMRFEDNNYLFIYDFDGNNIVTAPAPEREGTNMIDAQTPDGTYLIRDIIELARSGGGYYSYVWDHPGTQAMETKHSFVGRLEKWDWLIGAGVYVVDMENALAEIETRAMSDLRDSIGITVLMAAALFIAIAMLTYAFVRRLVGPIKRAADAMLDIAQGRGDLTRRLTIESNDEVGESRCPVQRLCWPHAGYPARRTPQHRKRLPLGGRHFPQLGRTGDAHRAGSGQLARNLGFHGRDHVHREPQRR